MSKKIFRIFFSILCINYLKFIHRDSIFYKYIEKKPTRHEQDLFKYSLQKSKIGRQNAHYLDIHLNLFNAQACARTRHQHNAAPLIVWVAKQKTTSTTSISGIYFYFAPCHITFKKKELWILSRKLKVCFLNVSILKLATTDGNLHLIRLGHSWFVIIFYGPPKPSLSIYQLKS